jgi:mono/diheme cytochrome c family protein
MRKFIVWTLAGLLLGIWVLGAPGASQAQGGRQIFMDKCAPCHGADGKGDGPLASTFDPRRQDFCDPGFWQGGVDKKIYDTVTLGKGQMIPVNLNAEEIKAVTTYLKSSCQR